MDGTYQLQEDHQDSSLLQRVGARAYNAGAKVYQSSLRALTGILTLGLTLSPGVAAFAQPAEVSGYVPFLYGSGEEYGENRDVRQIKLENGNLTTTDDSPLEACVDEVENTTYAALEAVSTKHRMSEETDDRDGDFSGPTYCVDLTAEMFEGVEAGEGQFTVYIGEGDSRIEDTFHYNLAKTDIVVEDTAEMGTDNNIMHTDFTPGADNKYTIAAELNTTEGTYFLLTEGHNTTSVDREEGDTGSVIKPLTYDELTRTETRTTITVDLDAYDLNGYESITFKVCNKEVFDADESSACVVAGHVDELRAGDSGIEWSDDDEDVLGYTEGEFEADDSLGGEGISGSEYDYVEGTDDGFDATADEGDTSYDAGADDSFDVITDDEGDSGYDAGTDDGFDDAAEGDDPSATGDEGTTTLDTVVATLTPAVWQERMTAAVGHVNSEYGLSLGTSYKGTTGKVPGEKASDYNTLSVFGGTKINAREFIRRINAYSRSQDWGNIIDADTITYLNITPVDLANVSISKLPSGIDSAIMLSSSTSVGSADIQGVGANKVSPVLRLDYSYTLGNGMDHSDGSVRTALTGGTPYAAQDYRVSVNFARDFGEGEINYDGSIPHMNVAVHPTPKVTAEQVLLGVGIGAVSATAGALITAAIIDSQKEDCPEPQEGGTTFVPGGGATDGETQTDNTE
jgi:hypothetical protein